MTQVCDKWAAGATYEDFMGRWSRSLAPRFVSWLAVPAGAHWLDVGCGTGALADAVCAGAEPASVVACDPAAPFIEYARGRQDDSRVAFVTAGVDRLPEREGGFDCVASLLALNFFPAPDIAVGDMRRMSAPGGTVAACVWDYAGRMQFLRRFWDAARAADPDAAGLDEGVRFPLCRPEALEALFRRAGLADVAGEAIEIPTRFSSFDEFWRPFLGGTGPAPSYLASLDPRRREALAAAIEGSLPRGPGGSIPLVARAWAVRGTVR